MLPCVYEIEQGCPPKDFVHEYHCTIRQRLGVSNSGKDKWFEITNDTASLATTIVDLLDRSGLDFFERFKSYNDVITHYNEHGDLPFQNSHRASLDVALIAFHIGDKKLSKTLFEKARSSSHKGFREHVSELERRVHQIANLTAPKN